MPKFLTGDSFGNLKAVHLHENNYSAIQTLKGGVSLLDSPNSISQLATVRLGGLTLVASGYVDSSVSLFTLDGDTLYKKHTWSEPRAKKHPYVGISLNQRGVFTCSANGALRRTVLDASDTSPESHSASLPTRLTCWKMPDDPQTFAYGGQEVDVSVWNTERAFQFQPPADTSNKRKRTELFSGEVWRAKNVQHDNLNLRQPVRITALAHLSPSNILAATQLGSLKRYDTRSVRKPVCDWSNVFNGAHAVTTVEVGHSKYEAFISDHTNKMAALDLRTGRILYRYDGISGTITSIVSTPTGVASISLDRNFRFHSTTPPPPQPGQNMEGRSRGKVLSKVYSPTTPTVLAWDQESTFSAPRTLDEDDDDVWNAMKHVGEEESGRSRKTPKIA